MRIKRTLWALLAFVCVTSLAHAGPSPSAPLIQAIHLSSFTVSWGSVSSDNGYVVEASTSSDFLGVLVSSEITPGGSDTSLTLPPTLAPNTTYYLRVGALWTGSTDYAPVAPASMATLSDLIWNAQVAQVFGTSVTANWSPFASGSGPNTALGYLMEVSSTNFSGGAVLFSSNTLPAVSTLTVTGLLTSTTYYARAGAMNSFSIPNLVDMGSFTTTSDGGLSAPTGINGVPLGPSSIQWSWTVVPSATNYILYYASAPAVVLVSTPNTTWTQVGLQPNVPSSLVIRAFGGAGLQSPLSSSVTVYTQANMPGVPGGSAIGTSSFTVTWTTGNPAYTPYEVLMALDSGFTVSVSTPVSFAANLTANTTNITGLISSTPYYVRIRARNGDGVISAPSPITIITTLSGGGAVGQGTATVIPASIPEGAPVQTTTITFIVPTGGFTPGGGVSVKLPVNWGPFLQTNATASPGYVSAVSNPSKTLVVTPLTIESGVDVTLAGGQTLAAGTTIQVFISNLWANCPPPNQTTVFWTVSSRSSSGGTFSPVPAQPSQNLATGAARYLGFSPWDVMTAVSGQASAVTLTGRSGCGNPAPMGAALTVNLSGTLSNYTSADPNAAFFSDAGMTIPIVSTVIAQNATTTTFYYKTTSLGNNLSLKAEYNDIQGGYLTNISRSVNVLSSAVTFSGLSLDNGAAASGSSAYVLTPDNDGTNDFVFVRFSPSDATLDWRVRISSDGFNSWVYERWGRGDPQGTLQWDGRNNFGNFGANSIVPNATYQVRVEIPGLTPNNSLTIAVQGASISGRVLVGATGVPNAWVNANATSGTGFGGAMTNASGNFTINGLRTGQSYNLFTNFYDPTLYSPMSGSLPNIPAGSTTADIVVSQPARLRVVAAVNPSPTVPLFGQVNAHTANYSQNYWGSIRVQVGSTTSDNNDSFNPSTWTVLSVQPGVYTIQLNLQGFSPETKTITAVAGVETDVPVFSLTRPANVYGKITLPAAVSNASWISVEGVLSGNTFPTVWGGVFFNVGQSSGVYQLFNVAAGTYKFRYRAPGFIPVEISSPVTGADIGDFINGGLDIPSTSFGTGGKITGTVTVQGNTSATGPNLNLWINAHSPTLGSGEFTQITLSTDTALSSGTYQIGGLADGTYQVFPPYLSGFELTPPGPKTVTVASGVGTLNLLLKQNTGAISGTILLPGANSDYGQVTISVQGPNMSTTTVATGSSYTIPALGSGFFDITGSYGTTGAQMRRSVAVVNGQTSPHILDLSAPTYVVSGSVTIQSAFTLVSSSGSPVTINTITDMRDNDTTQFFYLNGAQQILPTARVEAFPKRFDSYGNSNRTGFNNTFFGADYKSGAIQADGSYSIPGISPGVWEVSVYPYLDGSQTPSLAVTKQTLTVAGHKTAVNFNLSAGYTLGGTISLPGGASDNRNFDVRILTERGDDVQSSQIALGAVGTPASSVTYLFKNLAPGRYVLVVRDPGSFDATLNQFVRKYVAKPAAFEITSANIPSLNVTMARASRIIGKLSIRVTGADGTLSSSLVTTNNTTVLPDNLRVAAVANPWVEGGYQPAATNNGAGAATGMGRIDIDANNQFHIDGLVPGTYDVQFRQDTFGTALTGQGSVNLAAYTQGQVKVTEGQVVDLGTIELKQGLSLSGTVRDTSGNLLPNIRVRSETSGNQGEHNNSQTFTDAAGQFTLTGLNPDLKSYDIVVAPRPSVGDLTPPSAYGEVTKKAVDVTQTPLPTLSFTLSAANASLSGQVLTIDNGPLGYPDGDKQQGYPAAAIYMQQQGVPTSGNDPLGEIHEATGLDGSYSITSLVPGKYDVQVISLNYKPYKFSITVNPGSNSADDVTLQTGAILETTLLRPDGSGVNTDDVRFAVAATADLGVIIFGQIQSDDNTRTIRSIRFSGFDSTKRYSVLLFDRKDNITTPIEGRGLTFASDTEEKTLSLTYQPSAPTAFTQIRKVGSAAEVTFYFSRTLRNTLPTDSTLAGLMTVVSGNGSFSSFAISGDRQSLSVLYTPPADEQTATIRFSGYAADVDPATGTEFPLTKSLILRFGQRAVAEKNISPVLGGEVTLSETANDPSGVVVPANALQNTTGTVADISSNFAISFTVTEDVADIIAAPGFRSKALGAQMERGSAAYIPEAYLAMQTARANAAVNPFSAFYSVLLPAGLSHTLNQTASLTLQYDTNADPTEINIYYFDGTKYLIERTNRTIDTVNHTITVGVSHFSTFVVLESAASVVLVDGTASALGDIEVFNFPNPFDLTPKIKTLDPTRAGAATNMPTDGTIIRYTIPAAKAGAASVDIYNVIGEKVRSINLGTPTTDVYHYATWDGKNDSGNKVASGVYIGVFKAGGHKKIWKMAVIK